MKKRGTSINWAMIIAMICILSCGGGGGGGGGGTTLTPASVDNTTAAEAVSMVSAAAPLMALDEEFGTLSGLSDTEPNQKIAVWALSSNTNPSQKIADWVLSRVEEKIFSTALYQAAGRASESENCSTGNMIMDITWDGPETVVDCSQASNVNATIQFNQCSEGGSYFNGRIYLHISGNLCNPSAMSMDFDNVNIQSGEINASMNSFSIDFSMSGDTTSATFNGDVSSGSTGGVSDAMNFSNFNITDTETFEGDSATISGAISGSCFSGWVTFATSEPVFTPYYSDCPASGQVTVSGDGEVTVTFNSDYSVTVGDTEYASCDNLPQTCQ